MPRNPQNLPTQASKGPIAQALRKILTPVIRLLIELGFSFGDFCEIAKLVYVDVASRNYGIKGRQTNTSRVAIMTGLTRREVARLRKVLDNDPNGLRTANTVAGIVLAHWHHDSGYLEGQRPKPLPLHGPGSLTELINKVKGDVPATSILKELTRVGAVRIQQQTAHANASEYMPSALDRSSIERFSLALNGIGLALSANIPGRPARAYQGRNTTSSQTSKPYDAFCGILDAQGESLLERVDEWVALHGAHGSPARDDQTA